MFKAYRYRIYPDSQQRQLIAKHFGASRFVYNYGLAQKVEAYKKDKGKISRFDLQKQIVLSKKDERPWLKEVNAQTLQFALFSLESAFSKFFQKKAKFPRFKSKMGRQSFSSVQYNRVNFEASRFYCPKFSEGIKTKFSRRFSGVIKTCTISKTPTGKYFVSILVDEKSEKSERLPIKKEKTLGIDLGISTFATFSNGEKVANPKFLTKKLKKLRRVSRQHSKKKKGSNNRSKAKVKLAKIHEKVTNARLDFQHKLSRKIAENQSYNCVGWKLLIFKECLKITG
jgi:putative transposase